MGTDETTSSKRESAIHTVLRHYTDICPYETHHENIPRFSVSTKIVSSGA